MKKIIFIFAILFLTIIIILNIAFTTELDASEHAVIHGNHIIYIIGVILTGIIIYFITQKVYNHFYPNIDDETKKKLRKKYFICIFTIYIILNIVWVLLVNPKVVGDAVHVCNLAQTFHRGNPEEFLQNPTYVGVTLKEYMQAYPQQISLAFVYSVFFRIIHFDIMEILRVINIIGNIGIVITLYKISNQISKEYKTNQARLLICILTFISLPMLVTYIYGDIPSLSLCLFSVYFMMKYAETKKISYPIIASICTMIAYMMRMNSLIFIIATFMYLVLIFIKERTKTNWKQKMTFISMIVLYIVIAIFPASLVKNYYFLNFDLDKSKIYPNTSYLLMAMEEGPRGNGWYNEEIASFALKNPEETKNEYPQKIKDRLGFFSKNLGYTFQFYTMKITSMWTENTYAAIRNNTLTPINYVENFIYPVTFYQKALLLCICVCSLVVLVQNRKNLSNELIFLATIFIGGFSFHILWEAKSRYIIPYIIVLIPIAAIQIQKFNKIHEIAYLKIVKKIKNMFNQ